MLGGRDIITQKRIQGIHGRVQFTDVVTPILRLQQAGHAIEDWWTYGLDLTPCVRQIE
ncbi:MAG: hypothetical protein ACRD45_21010 [Bryobacteraceae bacterium]